MHVLNLSDDNRVLSVGTYYCDIPEDAVCVESFPEGDIYEYRYVDGEFIHDPLPVEEIIETPSQLDIIEAQVTYTAMMTNTFLEV